MTGAGEWWCRGWSLAGSLQVERLERRGFSLSALGKLAYLFREAEIGSGRLLGQLPRSGIAGRPLNGPVGVALYNLGQRRLGKWPWCR